MIGNKQPLALLLTDTHLNRDNVDLNKSIFRQAIMKAKEYGFAHIYHKGDIFDSRLNQSLRTLLAFKSILNDFKEHNITLRAIPGNHDKVDYESDRSYLDVYSDHPNFELYSTPTLLKLSDDIDVCLVPYYKETTIYKQKLDSILPRVKKKTVLLTHCALSGVRNNDGSLMGERETPPMESFDVFEKIFVGHYHNAQALDNGRIVYPGSSMPHNYGEDNEKGIVLVYNNLSWQHLKTDFPHYIKVQFDVKEDDPKAFIETKQQLKESDHFRIEVIGTSAEIQAFDKNIFTKHGIDVKKKNQEIETNITMVQEVAFESHTAASITKEFDVFCKKNKITKADKQIGDKYIKRLENVEF